LASQLLFRYTIFQRATKTRSNQGESVNGGRLPSDHYGGIQGRAPTQSTPVLNLK